MKIFFSAALCFCLQSSFGQKLGITSLETILYASFTAADSLLKEAKFKLADKETGKGYHNYYYTSYEKVDSAKQLLRSLSLMDVFDGPDTSRFILYRTYNKNDQEEMKRQLIANGYELFKRSANDFIYKKESYLVTNRISEKNVPGSKPVTAYEFELGR
jgi:phosphoribosylaminoimidazole-succinocarboxamide synthase